MLKNGKMLSNEMWNIFLATGNIHAYLYCKDSYKLIKKKDINGDKGRMLQGL